MGADRPKPADESERGESDEGIRTFVEKLLEIRRETRAGKPLDPIVAASFAALASRVYCELTRPLADALDVKVDPKQYEAQPIESTRAMIADALTYGFPLPDNVGNYVANALEALNAGHTDELFREVPGRKGVAPHIVAEAKLKLLMWNCYQRGLGRKKATAEAQVAEKVCRTHEAIGKWPSEISKVYGDDKVRSLLHHAQLIGEAEKASQQGLPERAQSELRYLEALCQLDRDVDRVAEVFRLAVTLRPADLG